MKTEDLRNLFEKWFLKIFGSEKNHMLSFDSEDGYLTENVNCMWIGFCGGQGVGL